MKFFLVVLLPIIFFNSAYASQISTIFIGKWGTDRAACRGIVNGDDFRVLSIKNSEVNQIKDERYEGYSNINITRFIESPANELYGVGFRYTFHSEEPGSLYREQEKVHYVLIDNKLYSIDEYVSENGQIESFTTSFTRC